jgi:plastocyanin
MTKLAGAVALVLVCGALVGCASPAPTPIATPTPAPSVAPTDAPSVAPSMSTASPEPSPSPVVRVAPSPVVSLPPSPAASGPSAALSLEARDLSFSPAELQAAAGQPFELTLHNAGRIAHNVTIDAPGVRLAVAAGQTASVTVEALEPGTYPFYCSVSGHRQAGMAGTLTVR